MKVFNIHKALREILKDRIYIDYKHISGKLVNYGEGDLKELVKIISKKNDKYPFLWLKHNFNTPIPLKRGVQRIETDLEFIILLDGNKNDLYYKRFEDKYENIIYPIVEAFLEVINRVNGISVIYDNQNPYTSLQDYPFNLTNDFDLPKDEVSAINTVWDASIFNIRLRFNPECFEDYNNNNNNNNFKKYEIKWH